MLCHTLSSCFKKTIISPSDYTLLANQVKQIWNIFMHRPYLLKEEFDKEQSLTLFIVPKG